jgi:Tfp pilus assembly protein PilE
VKSGENEKGLTLVEIILTVLILGIAFVAIMSGLRQAALIRGESSERMFVANLARQQLERLKIFYGTNNGTSSDVWNTILTKTKKSIDYTVTTAVIDNPSPSGFATDNGVVPVRATVSWSSHGEDKSFVLETCYAIADISAIASATATATPTPTPTPTPTSHWPWWPW